MEILTRTSEDSATVMKPLIASDFIATLAAKKTTTTAPHERADLIGQFLAAINNNAKPGFKKATFSQINGQLRHKDNHELYVFLKECYNARSFGAFFWWKLKEERLSTKK